MVENLVVDTAKIRNWISKNEFHIYEWPKYREKFKLLEGKKRHYYLYGMKHKRESSYDTKLKLKKNPNKFYSIQIKICTSKYIIIQMKRQDQD